MNKIDNIANFLDNNSKKCLAINGSWGIGKTYLWKQVEKKLSKDKKVVYIDLFGKESYKQILEEIVVSLHGDYNKITKTTFKGLEGLVKSISGGLIDIDSDAIFSFLKKEDFDNIIVCFDNIERRSDNLSLKEILGLVNLLKEEKECNVVVIFHEEELKEQDNNLAKNNKEEQTKQYNSKNWYQIYKEKVIDCEITIKNNDEVAKAIIKDRINKYTKITDEIKNIIGNIIFERYKEQCNGNLRLLYHVLEHIDYFNKQCFLLFCKYDNKKTFSDALKLSYISLIFQIKKYLSIKIEENDISSNYHLYEKYLKNMFYLNKEEKYQLRRDFYQTLKIELYYKLQNYKIEYLVGNLSDEQFVKDIENSLLKIDFYSENGITRYPYGFYQNLLSTYTQITNKKLSNIEEKINKHYIEALVMEELEFDFHDDYKSDKNLLKLLENEKWKDYYEETKEKYKTSKYENINALINSYENIESSFYLEAIKQYNFFKKEELVQLFKNNNDFCKKFFNHFSMNMVASHKFDDDLNNNLFQAYLDFLDLDENKIKKVLF
ncbi:KAP family NTPase [Campylobacter sp. IFREMER_LSEM_CL1846]|uniref:KAP family NTPase n=1 Tax=Campylobacter sp. IFREMER_LSEM_CL1846 TaxID=2911614 RepID=UPI0021E6C9BE|nr:KAP family NTPase [Campylobacter sp. IFREMER_LSEM_CL1846]MCV3434211.1 KAP family NTPase [Campylobacter sp. IFREMER_LSEM_CL1846]HEC1795666.1 AAA family ATPase [Campylobacter lari]HEC1798758.1 AAA family ATPase [Campylobacter lari]